MPNIKGPKQTTQYFKECQPKSFEHETHLERNAFRIFSLGVYNRDTGPVDGNQKIRVQPNPPPVEGREEVGS